MRKSSSGLAQRRARLWDDLQPHLRKTPSLHSFAGGTIQDLPISDVSTVRSDYANWNSLGLSHNQLHAAALSAENGGSGEVLPGVVAGYSTGTSGNRGIFVANEHERADYIGQSLARLLPLRSLVGDVRVALILRADSRLYSDVGSGRISFSHYPLSQSSADTAGSLDAFSPTILIAPSHRLLEMAERINWQQSSLPNLRHVFFGAEPMSMAERLLGEQAFGIRPDPIYQATEGFIAASCKKGKLHLNEHSLIIEEQPITGTAGFRPILTDLRRFSQPIVRVRGDDYLEFDPAGCNCGYAGRVIHPVMGRASDIWRFENHIVTPMEATDALDAVFGPATPCQAIAGETGVSLHLDKGADNQKFEHAAEQFRDMLRLDVPVSLSDAPLEPAAPKRARVKWIGAQGG